VTAIGGAMTRDAPRSPPRRVSLVLSDVDGTLVTRDKRLTAASREAISALRSKNIHVALASSRPPFGLRSVLDASDIDGPVASFNGGLISSRAGDELAAHWLPRDVAASTIQFFDEWGMEVWAFTAERWLCRDPKGDYVAHEQGTVSQSPTIVQSFDADLDRYGKIVAVSADPNRLANCELEAQKKFGARAQVARSQAYYLDVTHPSADKGDALTTISRATGVPLDECVAIGDGANDIPMLQTAAYGIAMGNGVEQLRNRADFVSKSNEDEGFAFAVKHILEFVG
jgi:Cof subfamily protein (haloacid dehalogenase superfamily)